MKLIDTQFHMRCGCVLIRKQLGSNGNQWICPDHKEPIIKVKRPCSRCGKTIESRVYRSSVRFCDGCNQILQLARIVHSQKGIKIIADPILQQKNMDKIGADLFVNMILGREEIQIDPAVTTMGSGNNIRIDIERKIQILKEGIIA